MSTLLFSTSLLLRSCHRKMARATTGTLILLRRMRKCSATELLRNQIPQASTRSVGEPAEGSLPREGPRAPGGFGLQLFTHCVPTFVALAGHEVRLTPAFGLVSARQRPFNILFIVTSE